MATVTIRDLSNEFPKVKEVVEAEGEVVVAPAKRVRVWDYMARMRRHQSRPLSAAAAKPLHDENRGER